MLYKGNSYPSQSCIMPEGACLLGFTSMNQECSSESIRSAWLRISSIFSYIQIEQLKVKVCSLGC
jgi:hypothetical protein